MKNDLIIDSLDYKQYYKNNLLHRENGPAFEYKTKSGRLSSSWYVDGKLHRIDGPAVQHANGDKEWHQNGLLHRVDGPAIDRLNVKEWYCNGKLHKEDGPASTLYTYRNEHDYDFVSYAWVMYYNNGLRHRTDGPALTFFINGIPHSTYWYFNNTHVKCKTLDEFKEIISK